MYQIKSLKIVWMYYWLLMKISHIMSTYYRFNRFKWNKTKCKNRKHFCRSCLQWFSREKVLTRHKEVYLKINGRQTVKLKSPSIKFKNYHKQLAAPLKISLDFECNVEKVESSDKSSDIGDNASYTEKYQDRIPCSFAYKFACVDNKFSKTIVLCRGGKTVYKFIEAILKEYDDCKKK